MSKSKPAAPPADKEAPPAPSEGQAEPIECGIMMPISGNDHAPADHWAEVYQIIVETVASISEPRMTARLVSEADAVGVIHRRIVQQLYSTPIAVCDVSGKNPNVMFELGMRLAFDRPVVVVKDDKTGYSFDTSPIEHLPYPRDLRFQRVLEFKQRLAEKVKATYQDSLATGYSPFLKSFGDFHVATVSQKTLSPEQYLVASVEELRGDMARLTARLAQLADPYAGVPWPQRSTLRALALTQAAKRGDLPRVGSFRARVAADPAVTAFDFDDALQDTFAARVASLLQEKGLQYVAQTPRTQIYRDLVGSDAATLSGPHRAMIDATVQAYLAAGQAESSHGSDGT